MTRAEYDILREHGERLLHIDKMLRELPTQIAERMEVKVATALASCREAHAEDEARLDELWEQHQHEEGAKGLIDRVSARTSFLIGAGGGALAIVATAIAIWG